MASFKAKFPVLQELFLKNHRGALCPPPQRGEGESYFPTFVTSGARRIFSRGGEHSLCQYICSSQYRCVKYQYYLNSLSLPRYKLAWFVHITKHFMNYRYITLVYWQSVSFVILPTLSFRYFTFRRLNPTFSLLCLISALRVRSFIINMSASLGVLVMTLRTSIFLQALCGLRPGTHWAKRKRNAEQT